MDIVEDYSTSEELEEYFSKKISLLDECFALKYIDKESKIFFQHFESSMVELQNIFQQIKQEVKESKYQLTEMKDLLKTMKSLNDKLDHMQKNFPLVLKPVLEDRKNREKLEVAATPAVPKQIKVPAKMKYLTVAEFESIPKYMKGRLQYNQVNNFIDSFNKVITAKYKMMSVPRKLMKPAEYKICNMMKLQETEETKGLYFCTCENMKQYGNIKMDKSTSNFLTILRHSRRLKEVRGPGSFTRYVIIP